MEKPAAGGELVEARQLERGECFVKRTAGRDGFAYLVISASSLRQHGMDPEKGVFGVCYNGNMTWVPHTQTVWRVPFAQIMHNRGKDQEWDEEVGAIHEQPPDRSGSERVVLPDPPAGGSPAIKPPWIE